jgi:hypothetical protein
MRNLKKVLALVLALVMSLSLVTIAHAADFSDAADINYDEAIDVMVAAGIIDGVGNNQFDPKGTLTREQAAKLITYMLMGENSNKLGVESSSFKDVAVTRWSAPAIEYCVSLGIIDGAGDGNFYPAGKLTGYAFAKMLLTAIGYDSQLEGFTGAGWTIPVATIAMDVGLDDGLETMFGSAELTREEAAQMALNAIQTPLVKYDKQATISVNGAEISMGDAEASYVTTTIAKTQTISKRRLTNTNEYTIEFGEKYLTKLERKTANDDFGRPSYTWSYDKKDIGTYVDRELLHIEYTAEVTGEMLYNDIGSSTLKDANVTVYIDGVDNASINSAVFGKGNIVKSNTKKVGDTGNGVLTQVFIDTEGDEADITIAIVNTYLAKAAEDYDDRNEDIDLDVYGLKLIAGKANKDPVYGKEVDRDDPSVSITVKNDDIDVSEMKEDDIVLVTVADGMVQSIESPEVVSNVTITNFKKDKYVTADSTKYDYSSAALYDEETLNEYNDKNMKDLTYNVYLDEYGYAIGVEKNEEPDQYVFVTGVDGNGSNFSSKNADVNVIFLDGTMKVVEVNVKDSDINFADGAIINTWCTYTVDKNNVYTLEQVAGAINTANKIKVAQSAQNADDKDDDKITIDKKHVSLDGGSGYSKVYGNDNTVYINVELEMINSATSFEQTGTNGKLGSDTWNGNTLQTPASGAQQNYVQTNGTAQWNAAIIDDVESVTVGVKNVSLDIKNIVKADYDNSAEMAVPLNEVYTLYKDNGYVIAAVVIGDSGGVSSSYAYITSDSYSNEGYDKTEDEWTWSREAIVDGKIVDLTESGSTIKYLNKMAPNNWYEVKYDAKGNVRGIKNNGGTNGAVDFTDAVGKYPSKVDKVEKSVDANDTVLMMVDYHSTKGLMTYKAAGTLYTAKGPSEGFSVSPDVKTVVCLSAKDKNGNVEMFDDVTDGYTGYTGLEKAIRDLDDNFKGWLSVLFEDGVATVIIFNDYTGSTVDTGSDTTVDNRITDAEYDGRETVTIYYTGNTPNNMQIQRSIIDAIKEFEGVESVKGVSLDTADGQFDATIVWDDGSENSVVDYSYVLVNDNMSADVIEDIEEALTGNATTPYTFIGDITVKGNEITFKASAYSDKAKAMRDLARFLGAAHTELKVNSITFNDVDYKWDDDAVGGDGQPVLGSKWHKAADDEYCDTAGGGKTKNTLIGDIVTYANNSLGSLQIELDGVEYTFTFAES